MFCSKCGTKLQDGIAFCPKCGKATGAVKPLTPPTVAGAALANDAAEKAAAEKAAAKKAAAEKATAEKAAAEKAAAEKAAAEKTAAEKAAAEKAAAEKAAAEKAAAEKAAAEKAAAEKAAAEKAAAEKAAAEKAAAEKAAAEKAAAEKAAAEKAAAEKAAAEKAAAKKAAADENNVDNNATAENTGVNERQDAKTHAESNRQTDNSLPEVEKTVRLDSSTDKPAGVQNAVSPAASTAPAAAQISRPAPTNTRTYSAPQQQAAYAPQQQTAYTPYGAPAKSPAKKKDKGWIYAVVAMFVVALAVGGVIIGNKVKISNDYKDAVSLMNRGDYYNAQIAFNALGDFENSIQYSAECQSEMDYAQALSNYESGSYYTAYNEFLALGDFKDSAEMALLCVQDYPSDGVIYYNSSYTSNDVTFQIVENYNSGCAEYLKLYLEDGTLVCSIFVTPNSTVSVDVTAGNYYINEAWGSDWFGEDDMFGDTGTYTRMDFGTDDNIFTFVSGHLYTLTLDSGDGAGESVGNTAIDQNSF